MEWTDTEKYTAWETPLINITCFVIASLRRMINLNSGVGNTTVGSETTFSVLIYDKHGQDIISPLLSVKDLREMGITLHM